MREKVKNWHWVTAFVLLTTVAISCDEVPEVPVDEIPNIPVPSDLSAFLSVDGVVLSWEYDTTFAYSGFNVLRSEDDQVTWVKQATVDGPPYVDSNLRTGFTYWYAVAGVDRSGVQGVQSAPFPARPALFAVIIEGGAPVTSARDVTLTFTAPALTQNVRFSEDSTFADTQWRDFLQSYPFVLSPGDGEKTVWGQFRDEAGSLTQPVESSIVLDTFAQIDSLVFWTQTGTDTIPPGDVVTFRIVPAGNETGGFAEVFIEGMGNTPVRVDDDGRNGDGVEGDGVYQRRYQFALSFRQRSMRMSSVFFDEAGNESVEREFEDNLYMSDPPDAVVLQSVTAVRPDTIQVQWARSLEDHFVNYSIYRDTGRDVDPINSVLAGTVSNQSTTVFEDTGLLPATEYFYRVYVVNDLDEGTGSNVDSTTTAP